MTESRFRAAWLAPALVAAPLANAQETDVTQTPNTLNAGIKKSYTDEIGAGRGDILTPDSSAFIIARDPFRSIVRGRQLFQRKFTVAQGFGPRTNDGIGDIETDASHGAGLADSCAACHARPKGSAGFGSDVFTRPDSRDAPHLFGLGLQEMLADEITADLRAIRDKAATNAQQFNAPIVEVLHSKGIDYGTITAFPNGSVDLTNIEGVDGDLRVKPFFAEGSTWSIRDFTVGALNAEMGMESPDADLIVASAGQDVTTPSGLLLSGTVDVASIGTPPVVDEFHDADMDGVVNEVPTAVVDHMEFYLLNYFKPGTYRATARVAEGREQFEAIGCAECHIPDLRIDVDRRVADVETVYDSQQGVFNHLFATATPLFQEVDDMQGHPTLKVPLGGSFLVENIYTDFKRHDLGPEFHERNFDGSMTTEFMTEPLWGVGSTAPYGHDGRSINLREVIVRHGGEAEASRRRFSMLGEGEKRAIEEFLQHLVLFPPPDTASNLNPGNPNAQNYPQEGHGSIDLSVLFNDSSDKE